MIDTILGKVKAGLDGIKDQRMQSGNLQHTLGDTLNRETVFPLEVEPIQQQDGSLKNDCEQNNKTFNTLKNQGYQLEHNVGHRQRYLSSVLACLVMLAFLTDQVAQHADACFKKALAYCKTRKNLFEKVQQVFDLFTLYVNERRVSLYRQGENP